MHSSVSSYTCDGSDRSSACMGDRRQRASQWLLPAACMHAGFIYHARKTRTCILPAGKTITVCANRRSARRGRDAVTVSTPTAVAVAVVHVRARTSPPLVTSPEPRRPRPRMAGGRRQGRERRAGEVAYARRGILVGERNWPVQPARCTHARCWLHCNSASKYLCSRSYCNFLQQKKLPLAAGSRLRAALGTTVLSRHWPSGGPALRVCRVCDRSGPQGP
jgi:hypothetical protein